MAALSAPAFAVLVWAIVGIVLAIFGSILYAVATETGWL